MKTDLILPTCLYQRSSLYGASLVASEFDDSNIVVWGPRGCTSQIIEAMNTQRQQFDYYHFSVTEADILTNGLAKLKNNLLTMVEEYINKGPLFLFLGDATQLTSENVEDFIKGNISDEFPIVYVETGFKGNLYDGINETLHKIFKRLCNNKQQKKANKVNLIPEIGLSPHWRSDAYEISRILEILGFEVNIIPNRSITKDVLKINEASITILLNKNIGKKAALYIKEKYGVAIFESSHMPIGLLGTKLWLYDFNDFLGGSIQGLNELIEKEEEEFFKKVRPGLREENYNIRINKIRLSKFVICDELFRAQQWSRVLKEELNFKGGYINPTIDYKSSFEEAINSYKHKEIIIENEGSFLGILNDNDIEVILASDWIKMLNKKELSEKLIIINNPVIKQITLESYPYFGFRGMLFLLQDILNSVLY